MSLFPIHPCSSVIAVTLCPPVMALAQVPDTDGGTKSVRALVAMPSTKRSFGIQAEGGVLNEVGGPAAAGLL